MEQKVNRATKVIISLVMVICLLFVSLIGLTLAYNSDDKSFSGELNFGTVKLNVTATVSGSSVTMTDKGALELDKAWSSNYVSWTGTIAASSSSTITFNVSSKSGTEPAYYLAMLSSSNGAFTNCLYFSDGTNYYINNGNKTYLQSDSSKTAVTGKYVGILAKNATHSFSVTLKNSLTKTGSVALTVYAMQMANVDAYNTTDTTKSAYNQLTKYTQSYVYWEDSFDKNYTTVDYLEGSGTQYIDTGVNQTLKGTIDCKFEQVEVSNNYLFGGTQNESSMMYNGLYSWNVLEYNYQTVTYTGSTIVEMTQRLSGSNTIITINGTTTTVATGTSLSNTNRIYLFASWSWGNDVIRYYTAVRCYYFKMYENNVLVRDFVPCIRDSDGVAGMYDLVGEKFYTNAGSGTFSTGS